MHDDTDRFVFPELPDEAVIALEHFLEEFYTAFQNHYFAQMHRWYHELDQRKYNDDQMPLPIRRSDRPYGRGGYAAAILVDGPSPIVNISHQIR